MPERLTTLHAFEFSASAKFGNPPHVRHYTGWAGVDESGRAAEIPRQLADGVEHYAEHRSRLNRESTLVDLAQGLWDDLNSTLPLSSLELSEDDGATAYLAQQEASLIHPGQFSAAHRTYAPRLSEAENRALYGKCANLHGHNYRAEVALPPQRQLPERLWDEFDHVNLSADVPDLFGRNVVTEAIAELIARRAPGARWVRVWELPDFFAEYHRADSSYRLGRRYTIRTTHGPFPLEVVVRGELDPQTETAYDLGQLDAQCHAVIQTVAFAPTQARDAIQTLWVRLAQPARLGQALVALRLSADRQHHISLNRSEG
jgi:hypothetical protein